GRENEDRPHFFSPDRTAPATVKGVPTRFSPPANPSARAVLPAAVPLAPHGGAKGASSAPGRASVLGIIRSHDRPWTCAGDPHVPAPLVALVRVPALSRRPPRP